MLSKITRKVKREIFSARFTSARSKVPIDKIRCQITPFSERQGFSGKPIEAFPPCRFFKMYASYPEQGLEAFCAWYREWFVEKRGWTISKKEGGMAGGSLARMVIQLHGEKLGTQLKDIRQAHPQLLEEAIHLRVRHYLDLFDSIRQKGFVDTYAPINGFFMNRLYYLNKGHHRTSSLWVLGYKEIQIEIIK